MMAERFVGITRVPPFLFLFNYLPIFLIVREHTDNSDFYNVDKIEKKYFSK